jgi:hypothetical protein
MLFLLGVRDRDEEPFGITCNNMPHCMSDGRELPYPEGWFS